MVGVLLAVRRGHRSVSGSMYGSWYTPVHTDVHEERIHLVCTLAFAMVIAFFSLARRLPVL